VSDRAAVVCEPTAICVSALERTGVVPGETVVVLGPGPIGIISAMAARGMGAGDVVLVGRSSSARRLEVAREVGLEVWNSDEVDVVEAALERTRGRGVDLVVDSTGAGPAIASGVRALRRRGRLAALGVGGRDEIAFPWDDALFRALDVAFSFSSSYTSWDGALGLLASKAVDVEPLVTAFPLERYEDAFRAVEQREVVKAVLEP
jgi:threonine dehydrogenase-like Zn-dependent dehydrogenase